MFRSYKNSTSGNVMIVFALCIIPILLGVGFGLDYNNATSVKMRLQDLADGAVLSAVGHNASVDGAGMVYDVGRSKTIAETYFNHGLNDPMLKGKGAFTPNFTVTKDGRGIVTTLNYEADIYNSFGGIFGGSTTKIKGASKALSAPPSFIDVIAVIDTSSSMNIGASIADQIKMQSKMGCTFACHNSGTITTAHSFGATLRIDVVREALRKMLKDFKKHQSEDGQYRVSVYDFSNNLGVILSATTDLEKADKALATLGSRPPAGMGTNFTYSLNRFKRIMPTGGTGESATNRKLFVLLFTDGISDDVYFPNAWGGWKPDPNYTVFAPMFLAGGERMQGFNAADCTGIKSKKATVITMDIEYVVPAGTTDSRYVTIRDKLKPLIMANLRDCATNPSLAFVANDAAQIEKATQEMFNAIMQKARLNE